MTTKKSFSSDKNIYLVRAMEKKKTHADLDLLIKEYRKFITARLKLLMRKKHLGQEDLAFLMGIPQSHVSRIVTGKLNVTIDNLIKMLYYLDGSLDFENTCKPVSYYWQRNKEVCDDIRDYNTGRREIYATKYIKPSPILYVGDTVELSI